MRLETGALQVGGGPEHYRHSKEISMATLRAGTAQVDRLSKVLGERRGPRTGCHGTSELSPNNPKHRRISTCPRKQEGKQQKHTYRESSDPPAEGAKRPLMLQKPAIGADMHCPMSQESCSDKDAKVSGGVRIYSW